MSSTEATVHFLDIYCLPYNHGTTRGIRLPRPGHARDRRSVRRYAEDVDQRSSSWNTSRVCPRTTHRTSSRRATPIRVHHVHTDIDVHNADQVARVSTQWTFLRRERDDKLKASDWIVAVRTHRSRMNKKPRGARTGRCFAISRRPSRTSKTRSRGRLRLLNFHSSNRYVNRLPTVKFDGRHQDVRTHQI